MTKSILPANSENYKAFKYRYPNHSSPDGWSATTPELVAAVSNAGGLGSLGAGYMTADEIRISIKQIRQLTDKPFAVNLFIPEKHHATARQIEDAIEAVNSASNQTGINIPSITPPYTPSFEEQMEVIHDERIPVFSFTFGAPEKKWIEKLKNANVTLIGTATTLQEAKFLEAQQVDMIVAQGSEAGGHRGTFLGNAEDALIGIMSLIPSLIDHVNVPIIAAGGIMDTRGIYASQVLGASGVQMGTAFLACTESGIHQS